MELNAFMEAGKQLTSAMHHHHLGKHNGTGPGRQAPDIPFGTIEWWIVATVCLGLVAFAALMSGTYKWPPFL
jgi:hypothetical protein